MVQGPHRVPVWIRLQRIPYQLGRWLADLGALIVWPFEWAMAAVTRSIFAVSERFVGIEALLIGVVWVLLWPVRMLWRLLTAISDILPESVRNVVLAPFHLLGAAWHGLFIGFMRVAEVLNLDGLVMRLVGWTRPIWYPIAAVGGFCQAWLSTRDYWQLLWGLPVIIALLPLAGFGGWTLIRGRESFAPQYNIALREARDERDYGRVQLFQRKLAQLGASTEFTDFRTALAYAEDGDLHQAYEHMQQLAPVDEAGFIGAHLWIIDQLASGRLELPADESQRLLKIHLDHVRSLGARGPELDALRAVALIRDQQYVEAAALLEPHMSAFPPAAMLRMEINISLNQLDEARRDARMVRSHMEGHTRRGGTLSAEQCRWWMVAEDLLGNVPQAHSIAEKWYQLEPDSEVARNALVELAQRMFEATISLPDPDPDRLTELFIQAAELTTKPTKLQAMFASLYRLRADYPPAQQVVQRVVESERTPASILEAAGTMAAMVGEPELAKDYLRRAFTKDPQYAIAWNNYAWLLTQEPDGNLQKALDAVNKALEIAPNEFRYRETRGQVLVRIGRWQEAIEDLEFAANGIPESREIHLSLAKAYDALGDEQLARVHRTHAGVR